MSAKATLKIGDCILAERPRRHRTDLSFSKPLARLREIEAVIRARHGQTVPDPAGTEDRDVCLAYVLTAALSLAPQDMTSWCQRWAPWVEPSEIVAAEAQAARRRFMMSADGVAGMLQVTMAERARLRLKTIGACDMTKDERINLARQMKRDRDREAKRTKRDGAGRKERAAYEAQSLTRTKPWKDLGISRRTWERRRDASVSRVDILPTDDTLASTGPSARPSPSFHTPFGPSPAQARREADGEAERHGVWGPKPQRSFQEAEPHGTRDNPISSEEAA